MQTVQFPAQKLVMARLVLIALALAFVVSIYHMMGYKGGQVNAQSPESPTKRSEEIQATMYKIIHDLALPKFNEGGDITDRFILFMPGEVLNYYDYCPESLLKPGEYSDPDRLPADENAFKLADIVPSLKSFGEPTGKSLSNIYENILYTIDTSQSQSHVFDTEEYKSAMKYLHEEVADPENVTSNTTRFELYYRYKKRYYDKKLQVKQWLIGNKTERANNLSQYENWFHENYDSLEAYTSAAYTHWLVSGLKGPVEDRISVIDVKSIREEVEEARQALRDTEEPSLDGGSKYYPTHFVPSNWFQYLLADKNQLTKEQIQAKINDLTARKEEIQTMIDSKVPTENMLNQIKEQYGTMIKSSKQKMDDAAKKHTCFVYLCQQKRAKKGKESQPTDPACKDFAKTDDPCKAITDTQGEMVESRREIVQANTQKDSALNQLTAYSATDGSLNTLIKDLDQRIKQLNNELKNAPNPVPPAAADANGTGQLTTQEIKDNWMSFTFDSEQSRKSVDTESTTFQTALSFSASGFLWSVSGGASYSHKSQDFAQKMSNSDVSISAKFLRVTFTRNWFRPSLFNLGKLKMIEGINQVSPGPGRSELDYVKAAEKTQLPEYTTGFLLAKDISMKFRGVDSSTSSHAVQESSSASLSGSYGPFSASASYSYGHQTSNLRVSSTSDGLQIDIPGAQIIGYYTSVLPRFPNIL